MKYLLILLVLLFSIFPINAKSIWNGLQINLDNHRFDAESYTPQAVPPDFKTSRVFIFGNKQVKLKKTHLFVSMAIQRLLIQDWLLEIN